MKMLDRRSELDLDDFEEISTPPRSPKVRIQEPTNSKYTSQRSQSENDNHLKTESFNFTNHESLFEKYKPKKPARQRNLAKPAADEKRLSIISENPNEVSNSDLNQSKFLQNSTSSTFSAPYMNTSFNTFSKDYPDTTSDNGTNSPTPQQLRKILMLAKDHQNDSDFSQYNLHDSSQELPHSMLRGRPVDNRGMPVKNALLQIIQQQPQQDIFESYEQKNEEENDFDDEKMAEVRRKQFLSSHHREVYVQRDTQSELFGSQDLTLATKNDGNKQGGMTKFVSSEQEEPYNNTSHSSFESKNYDMDSNNLVSGSYSFHSTHLIYTPPKNSENDSRMLQTSKNDVGSLARSQPILNTIEQSLNSQKNENLLYRQPFKTDKDGKRKSLDQSLMSNTGDSRYSYNGVIEIPASKPGKEKDRNSKYKVQEPEIRNENGDEASESVKKTRFVFDKPTKNDKKYYRDKQDYDFGWFPVKFIEKAYLTRYDEDNYYKAKGVGKSSVQDASILDRTAEDLSLSSHKSPVTGVKTYKMNEFNSRKRYLQNIEDKNNNRNNNNNNKYYENGLRGLEEWRRDRMNDKKISRNPQDPRFELNKANRSPHNKRLNPGINEAPKRDGVAVEFNKTDYASSRNNFNPYNDKTDLSDKYKQPSMYPSTNSKLAPVSSFITSPPSTKANLQQEEKEVLKIFDDIYKEEGFSSGSERLSSTGDNNRGNYTRPSRKPGSNEIATESSYNSPHYIKASSEAFNSRYTPPASGSSLRKMYAIDEPIRSSMVQSSLYSNNRIPSQYTSPRTSRVARSSESPPRDHSPSRYPTNRNYNHSPTNQNYSPNNKSYNDYRNNNYLNNKDNTLSSSSSSSSKPYSHLLSDEYPYQRRLQLQSTNGRGIDNNRNYKNENVKNINIKV